MKLNSLEIRAVVDSSPVALQLENRHVINATLKAQSKSRRHEID